MANFIPNIEMPQEYIDTLTEIALEEGISAEQYAKQILMGFIGKNYPKGVDKP
jgi:hypothetical protein